MTIQEYIQHNRPLLQKHMAEYIKKKKAVLKAVPHADTRLDELLEFVCGGKNLRSIQVLLAYEANGGTDRKTALNIAAAVDLVHGTGLIHDDITDNDPIRYGKPSIYAKHMMQAKTQGLRNPLLFGQSQAIWLGDLGFFLAFELMQSVVNHANGVRIIDQFTRSIQEVCIAELNEMLLSSGSHEPTEQEILDVYIYKTGRYSIVSPLTLGALLAQAPEETYPFLEEFGRRVGIIFQIKDDEMGMFGDSSQTGKPVGSDIRENKKTLYRALLFQRVPQKERHILESIFGKESITAEDIATVSEYIHRYKVTDEVTHRLQRLETETRSLLDSYTGNLRFKTFLYEFLQMNLNRKK